MEGFRKDLEHLINRYNMERLSDTPDFILADYLLDCLVVFDRIVKKRDEWYGKTLHSINVNLLKKDA
jgi:hypothetical protein